MKWTWLDIKQPSEYLDHTVKVDCRGENISTVTITPSSPDLVVDNESTAGENVTFWVNGGLDGLIYEVDILAETAGGRKFFHKVIVPVGKVNREPETLDILGAAYKVRRLVRDMGSRNHLLMTELEFDWDEYEMAVDHALLVWNTHPPTTSNTLKNIDPRARRVLYLEAAAHVFQMGSHQQARNQNDYSDQGFSQQESNHYGLYKDLADSLRSQADLERRRFKTAKNMDAGWGGAHHDTYDSAPVNPYYGSGYGYPGETE